MGVFGHPTMYDIHKPPQRSFGCLFVGFLFVCLFLFLVFCLFVCLWFLFFYFYFVVIFERNLGLSTPSAKFILW